MKSLQKQADGGSTPFNTQLVCWLLVGVTRHVSQLQPQKSMKENQSGDLYDLGLQLDDVISISLIFFLLKSVTGLTQLDRISEMLYLAGKPVTSSTSYTCKGCVFLLDSYPSPPHLPLCSSHFYAQPSSHTQNALVPPQRR